MSAPDQGLPGGGDAVHTESEDHPWDINIPDHPGRTDSPEYVQSRSRMHRLATGTAVEAFYGAVQVQDHHGGGLWLKDAAGWFMVRNLAGMEWSSQFAADPAKVDVLRRNAQRLYAAFPGVADELGISTLLATPITDAAGIAAFVDSVANASVPLPAQHHTGVLPAGAGVHHYAAPVMEIDYFKRGDFTLWVTDPATNTQVAVVPVAPRGSGDGRVEVLHALPGTELHQRVLNAHAAGNRVVLDASHPLAQQAFAKQT